MKIIDRIRNSRTYQNHPILFVWMIRLSVFFGALFLGFIVILILDAMRVRITGTPEDALRSVVFIPSSAWLAWESYKLCKQNKRNREYLKCFAWGVYAVFELMLLLSLLILLLSGGEV